MHRRTIIACLASSFLGLAAFSGTASTGCSSNGSGSSGFSSSGGTSSSSSSSSGASSGSTSSSGSSSGGGTSSGVHDASTIPPNEGGIPLCGTTACDLKSNTCCLSETLQTMCIPHSQSCPSLNVSFMCLGKGDCTTAGQVCCGSANSSTMLASTQCQALMSDGLCGTTTPMAGYAQICEYTSECGGGLKCIAQTCAISSTLPPAHLSMCGLQSSPPFNCTAD